MRSAISRSDSSRVLSGEEKWAITEYPRMKGRPDSGSRNLLLWTSGCRGDALISRRTSTGCLPLKKNSNVWKVQSSQDTVKQGR